MNNTTEAVAEVIAAAGFGRVAADVKAGKVDARKAVHFCLRSGFAGRHKAALEKAAALIGPWRPDRIDIRRKIEGRCR